jgi:hypothetical protein
MLTSDQKGAIAESAIVHAALKAGIDVYKPVREGGRYDLIFEVGPRLIRVQCKWAVRHADVIVVRCHSSRRTRDGFRKRAYVEDEVDVVVAYCADVDRCYVVSPPVFSGGSYVQLRLTPTRNGQERGVKWAERFEFEAKLPMDTLGP